MNDITLIMVCKKISFENRASLMDVTKDKSSVYSSSVCGQSVTSDETPAAVDKK